MSAPYQLFDPLPDEQYAALKADIAKRGVLVPVELDEHGNILDGHHRVRACGELGFPDPPTIVRAGMDEPAKVEHVLKLNLLRRHLGPVAWAEAFRRFAEQRGVELDGRHNRHTPRAATVAALADEVGVKPRTARHRLQVAGELAGHPDLAAKVDAGDLTVNQARGRLNAGRRAALATTRIPPPMGRYATIVADPPWQLDSAGVTKADARKFYPTMSAEDIRALPVPDLAADSCHLWVWAINSLIEDAYRTVRAWGFAPVTMLTWCKPGPGVGHYLRNNTEHAILATRGAPMTPAVKPLSSWFTWPREAHSVKPQAFYDLVREVSPGPYLELFARQSHADFTPWGNEAAS